MLCFSVFIIDDEIKKLNDLIQAVQEVGDWIGLCRNLGVSEGKLDTLIQNPNQPANQQKAECLRAYFNMGKAKWSKVVEAVKKYPISNSRLARKIAEDHGLPFDDKDEL